MHNVWYLQFMGEEGKTLTQNLDVKTWGVSPCRPFSCEPREVLLPLKIVGRIFILVRWVKPISGGNFQNGVLELVIVMKNWLCKWV